jgi:hypothetical protein
MIHPVVEVRHRWVRPVTILVPTLRTWAIVAAAFIGLSVVFVRGVHGYLAPVEPVAGANTLVIESWANADTLEFVTTLTRSGRYRRIVVAGTPMDPLSSLYEFGTSADVWAARLSQRGVPRDRIEVVRAPEMPRHRTAHTALAVARHLKDAPATSVDLVTTSTHGRRSLNIYRQALAPARVGIYSAKDLSEGERWWSTSSGARSVVGELIALAYSVSVGSDVEQAVQEWNALPSDKRRVSGNWTP